MFWLCILVFFEWIREKFFRETLWGGLNTVDLIICSLKVTSMVCSARGWRYAYNYYLLPWQLRWLPKKWIWIHERNWLKLLSEITTGMTFKDRFNHKNFFLLVVDLWHFFKSMPLYQFAGCWRTVQLSMTFTQLKLAITCNSLETVQLSTISVLNYAPSNQTTKCNC